MDVARWDSSYDQGMTRVYLIEAKTEERSALRLLLLDLQMEVVGEAGTWAKALAEAPASHPHMVVVDWSVLTPGSDAALAELRAACPAMVVIVLISHLDAAQQAAAVTGADAFISKSEMPDRIAERLREAAKRVHV
jgi:two-component system, NarL family, response regulator DevR